MQTARAVAPHLEFDPTAQAAILRICRLVQGLPLAIELAAAWTRLLSCAEIADEVQNNLDFLEGTGVAGADQAASRQHSLRAVFLHAWRLLTPAEQQALRRLAVFRGGCTRTAATQVTGATLSHLAVLADRALLQTTTPAAEPGAPPHTRYELQDVIRQFATEHLAEAGEAEELAARHATYFRAWLASQEPVLRGAGQQAAAAAIAVELENVRGALRWHIQRLGDPATAELPDLWPAFAAAFHFLDMRSWFQEGEALFRQAAAALVPAGHTAPAPGAPTRLWALLSAREGWFAFHLADYEGCERLLRTSLERLLGAGAERAAGFNCIYLGAVYRHQGRMAAAEEALDAALRIAQAHGDAYETASAWNILGQVALLRGDLIQAQTCCRRALQIKREIGDRWGMTYALTYLGRVAQALGDLDEAAALFEESLAIYRTLGDRRGLAFSAANLADVARGRGDYAAAATLYRESLALYRAIGQRMETSLTLTRLAALHLAGDEEAVAAAHLRAALETARTIQSVPAMAAGLLGWAELAVRKGESRRALPMLAALHESPAASRELQGRAEELLTAVAGTQDLALLPARPLEELVDEILAEP
jgi:tetratricopeptide (TPR) repeat protein